SFLVAVYCYYIFFVPDVTFAFTWAVACVPLFLLLAFATALGLGVFLAALNAYYRDVNFLVPMGLQLLLLLSPVIYAADTISLPGALQWLYFVNPVAVFAQGMRFSLLGGMAPPLLPSLLAVAFTATILFVGLIFFSRAERTLADVL